MHTHTKKYSTTAEVIEIEISQKDCEEKQNNDKEDDRFIEKQPINEKIKNALTF